MIRKFPTLRYGCKNRVHHEAPLGIVYTHFQIRGTLTVMYQSKHTIKMPRQILQRDDLLDDVLALNVCVRTSTVTAANECGFM